MDVLVKALSISSLAKAQIGRFWLPLPRFATIMVMVLLVRWFPGLVFDLCRRVFCKEEVGLLLLSFLLAVFEVKENQEEMGAASSIRQVLSSIPAVICLRPWLARTPPHLQAEGRPSKKFLPADVHEGMQSSRGLTSASSSSVWCWRRTRGDDLAPSGSVPGGEVAGFVLRLSCGLDRVFQIFFRVLFAMSRDQFVISLLFSSLDVTCQVLMNI